MNQLTSESDYGQTTFAGFVDEPSTSKVNGKPAKMMSTDGGAPYTFQGLVDLDAGSNTVVVQATDGRNNTSTKSYSITTTGTSKTYDYDAKGNLRHEKQPDGTVIREYRWDQQNRLVKALIGTQQPDYLYDVPSRRALIQEFESGTQTKQETFVWCGSRICQKRNGSTVVRSYFEEGFEAGGVDNDFYTHDRLRSVREVVGSDGIGGVTCSTARGATSLRVEAGLPTLRILATISDPAYRPQPGAIPAYGDSGLGRWLSADPLSLDGGLNLYDTRTNSPV